MSKLQNRALDRVSLSTLTLCLTLISAHGALAQEAAVTPAAAEEPAPQIVVQPQTQSGGSIEEIIVTGQRTLQSLINEGARETENFYARLNVVIDNPDFEINCRNEYPTGSNISRRVCRMRYQEELDSRAALSAIQGVENVTDADGNATGAVFSGIPYDIVPEARAKIQEFEVLLVDAVNSDPELNASVVRLMQLKAAVDNYETTRQEERRERQAEDEAAN